MTDDTALIHGEKWGKGGGGRAPVEGLNTLQTAATARIVDLIGEGEIRGPVDEVHDGLRSVFIDGVPAADEDGNLNFQGLDVKWRSGTADPEPLEGIPEVESEIGVSMRVRDGAPVVRRITSAEVDSVRVTLRFPRLVKYNSRGDSGPAEVGLRIETRGDGQPWSTAVEKTLTDKNVAPAEISWRIPLEGDAPWDVRVTRTTPDSDSDRLSDELWWARYTEITELRQKYPYCAVVRLIADARQFRSEVTRREYEVYGRIVAVPSNYDPESREYTGLWDGTFKRAWTDNPAWCVYDLLTSRRFGLGRELSAEALSAAKWDLYTIARWCDKPVPDGRGGTEPRWRFTGVVSKAEEARRLLSHMLGAFRAQMYYGAGHVVPVHDEPVDPTAIVGPANTIDGEMSVSTQAWGDRVSAVAMSFNDPEDEYRLAVELVVDDDLIEKYGYRQDDRVAMFCTSRSQAQRHARHILIEQEHESDRLQYRGGLDQASLRPGDVIRQSDPQVAGARLACRVISVTLTETGVASMTLDALEGVPTDRDWTVYYHLPSGEVESRAVTSIDGDTLTLESAPSDAVLPDAMAVLESPDVTARLWRIESVTERDGLTFEVAARAYHPDRYPAVESGTHITAPNLTLIPSGPLAPPDAVTIGEHLYAEARDILTAVTVSVEAPAVADPRIVRTEIEIRAPDEPGYRALTVTPDRTAEIKPARIGMYGARARFIGEPPSLRSRWTEAPATRVYGKTAPPEPPTDFVIDPLPDGTRRYRWTPPGDLDLAGVQLAYAEQVTAGTRPQWTDMEEIHNGVLTADHYESIEPQKTGAYLIAARSVDTGGRASAPVYTVAELGPTRGTDAILWECPSATGWPGTRTNVERSDDGRDALEGRPDYTWADILTWEDWASWGGGGGDDHVESIVYDRGVLDLGINTTFSLGYDAEVTGTAAFDVQVADTEAALSGASWRAAGNAQTFTGRFIRPRWTISGSGRVPLSLDHLCWWVNAPSAEERLRDQNTANLPVSADNPGARVLPTSMRRVTDVDLVLQSVPAGTSWVLLSKTPPTIVIYDASGNARDAVIDAVIRGVR